MLDMQCLDCPIGRHGDAPCPILWMQLEYNYKQVNNPLAREIMNTLIDEKGNCQMKPVVEKYAAAELPEPPPTVMPAMREWAKNHGIKVA